MGPSTSFREKLSLASLARQGVQKKTRRHYVYVPALNTHEILCSKNVQFWGITLRVKKALLICYLLDYSALKGPEY